MSANATQAQKLRAALKDLPDIRDEQQEPLFKAPVGLTFLGYTVLYVSAGGMLLTYDPVEKLYRMLRLTYSQHDVRVLTSHVSKQALLEQHFMTLVPEEERLFAIPDDVNSLQQLYNKYCHSNSTKLERFGQWVYNRYGNSKYSCPRICYSTDVKLTSELLGLFIYRSECDNALLS